MAMNESQREGESRGEKQSWGAPKLGVSSENGEKERELA